MTKVLIIGGGVAGLSAGIYARLNGLDATIYERHVIPGGNLTGWQRGKYHIDNCIHWLTGTNPNTEAYRMWTELGALGDVDIYQGETLYTCEVNGERLSLSANIEKLRSDMLSVSPSDKKEINSFIKAVKAVQGISGIGGAEHNEKLGPLKTLASVPLLLKYYRLTTGELAERFSHPLLRAFFTSLVSDRFMSLALIFVFANYCGLNGGLPQGGSRAMAERMADRFTELGGKLILGKEVSHIEVVKRKAAFATLSDGTQISSDYVIVTADPAVVFGRILGAKMPRALKKLYANSSMPRFSSYHTAFSCDLEKLPIKGDFALDVPPEYRLRLGTDYFMIREFSHEKSFAPEGKNIIQTLSFCSDANAIKFIDMSKNEREYSKRKRRISEILQDIIEKKFPEMKGKLSCLDTWTPATYKRFVNSDIGSYMSFLLPSNVFPAMQKNTVKGLDNVILATQWLKAPGGLPIAADSGRRAVLTIMKKERLKFKRPETIPLKSKKQIGYGAT